MRFKRVRISFYSLIDILTAGKRFGVVLFRGDRTSMRKSSLQGSQSQEKRAMRFETHLSGRTVREDIRLDIRKITDVRVKIFVQPRISTVNFALLYS